MKNKHNYPSFIMFTRKKSVILMITVFEILAILFLLYYLIFFTKLVFKKISVVPVNKDEISLNKLSPLKYFYENQKNTVIIDIPPWKNGQKVKYSLNNDGLNSLRECSIDKPTSTLRIMAIGDSFTFGQFVNTRDNWTTILENLLNKKQPCSKYTKYEVINLGVMDYDIQYAAEEYRIKGKKYDPDLIIWFLKDDDFMTINEYQQPIYDKLIKELSPKSKEIFFNDGVYYPIGIRANSEFKKKYGNEKIIKYQQEYLNNLFKDFNNKLVLLTFDATDKNYKNIMIATAKENKSTYFTDGLKDFYSLKNTNLVFGDGHPNNNGHKKIAEFLFEFIIKNNSLKNVCF